MRSRLAIAGLAAIAVAAAGAGLASATASSGDEGNGRTFTVFSKTVQFAAIDLGDPGPSLGDQAVFSDDLFTEFEKNGLRDQATAQRYRKLVLAPGGTKPAADLVADFLGHPISLDAYRAKMAKDQ